MTSSPRFRASLSWPWRVILIVFGLGICSTAATDRPTLPLASIEATLHSCRTFTVVTSQGATGILTPLSFPAYASRQAGFVLSIPLASLHIPSRTLPSIPWELGFIIVQKGDYLVYLGYFPATGPFNPRQLEPYVSAALEKVPGT
jgi:hypothetical protein